ncbi:MAG: oligopeptide transport system permease protein [Verrucomicrobiota bacterium]
MYFLKRLVFLVPLLLLISALAFGLMKLAPGSPFDRDRVPATPDVERALKARYHYDEPVWKQYLRYFGLLWERNEQGVMKHAPPSFDISYRYRNHTVSQIIRDGLPVSMTLGGLAFCFAMGVGIPWGVGMAVRRGQRADHFWGLMAVLGVCIPALVIGPLVALAFAVRWQWFPVAMWETPLHFILPTFTLGLLFAGKVARLVRESMTTTLQSEFITAARAKGLGETAILVKHALRLALLPVVSFAAPMLADLLTGSFVVETIFQIPGVGALLVNSSLNRDWPLLMGLVLLYAGILLLLNLLADFTVAILDRRVRYE